MLRPELAPLDAYLADAAMLETGEFFRRHPWPVLVIPEPSSDVLSRLRRPETVIQDTNRLTLELPAASRALAGASLDAIILEIRPKRGPASNRISVGRSPEADIVLLDESVSRYHAELAWGPDRERCVLTDLGARNGTSVDGEAMTPNGKRELSPGAVVTFGALTTRFYSSKAFLAWLATGAPRAGASPGRWPQRTPE